MRQVSGVLSVALRFWILLTVILVLAIGAATYTLRVVAVPFLDEYQARVLQSQAEIAGQQLDARLERNQLLMQFVASDPNVVNLALGYSENADYFSDLMDTLPVSEDLSWVSFYDALGVQLAEYDIRSDDRQVFEPKAISAFLSSWLEDGLPERGPVLLADVGGVSHFVSATSVNHRGFSEGILLTAYRIDLGTVFPENRILRSAALTTDAIALEGEQSTTRAPLSALALSLVLEPDVGAVRKAGNSLIVSGTVSVATVLVAAFGLFAILGKRVIITPHLRLEYQAQRLETQRRELAELAAIAERANDAVLVTDLDGRLTWANPSFERMSGFRYQDLLGSKPGKFLQCADTDPNTIRQISTALAAREAVQVEILNKKRDQSLHWINLSISPLTHDTGETYGFMAISNDVTTARESREALISAKQKIEHQSLHDPLTGLPNRRALEQAIALRSQTPEVDMTLVRIDLDHFKYVNDTMGHEAGDYVLIEVAKILKDETKAGDLAVRVGGDEFVLLLAAGSTMEDGQTLSHRILERVREPKLFEAKTIRVGASFGVASLSEEIQTHQALIIAADAALYEAKEAGRNRVHLYTPELHRAVLTRRDLARELRLAVARDEFQPYFQPQFDAQTRQISGVETLARWQSGAFGLVTPDRFLPVAEQLSIVEEIDDNIFRKAVLQICALRNEGFLVPKLSVNVTAHRIQDPAVLEVVRNLPDCAPEVAFEVLESVLIEEQSSAFQFGLDLLREHGVEIEIDDFGSGHASIVGLMHLRPDAMKIDQQLVKPILEDPLARGMLERIVSMAELMELNVIAEGVETAEHADMLSSIGCHTLQGYYFARPMPVEKLREFLLQHRTEPDVDRAV